MPIDRKRQAVIVRAGTRERNGSSRRRHPIRKESSVHASIIDMTLRLPVDAVLFDELRTDFLPRASQHPGFCGFQYVLAEQGRAIGILWYEQPEDLDGITQLVGTWFQDHIAPRLAEPETAVRGRVVVNLTRPPPRPNATALA
jgi:hypothetical protein